MEIITIIDSSDDESISITAAERKATTRHCCKNDANKSLHSKTKLGKLPPIAIVTPREDQTPFKNNDDDDDAEDSKSCCSSSSSSSSISSADSIWDRVDQIPSIMRTKKESKKEDQENCLIISDDDDQSGVSIYDEDCCGIADPPATAAAKVQSKKDTAPSLSDQGSISSNDSIWDKMGLVSSMRQTKHDQRRACDNDVLEAVGQKKGSNDADDNESDENGHSSCSSSNRDLCKAMALLDMKQSKQDYATHDSCDDSSISSNESIWNKQGFTSQLSSSSNQNNKAEYVVVGGRANKTGDDEHSISSEDSIWDKSSGLAPQKVTARIESFYDYYRLKHSDTRKVGRNKKNTHDKSAKSDTSLEINNKKRSKDTDTNNQTITQQPEKEAPLPPEVPLPTDATWRIVLLMDHREFGCANNYLQSVEKKINTHFGGGKHCEITTLPSADYLYVARLISNNADKDGKEVVLDERVLDMVIERKNVADVCSCLITDSKKYKPLSFFEAQMYKLQHCGVSKKLFLMEGDEDKVKKNLMVGAKSQKEKERRLKRIKTIRMQLENGEFHGVDLICTRNRWDTVKYLIRQLQIFQQSFNHRRPPTKTREQLTLYINKQMKSRTFLEYLRLRKIPGIGDAKAMKVIMDPKNGWDKSFISPSSSKTAKSTLKDRPTFWKASPMTVKEKDSHQREFPFSRKQDIGLPPKEQSD